MNYDMMNGMIKKGVPSNFVPGIGVIIIENVEKNKHYVIKFVFFIKILRINLLSMKTNGAYTFDL